MGATGDWFSINNQNSTISLHAFAFAADEDVCHGVGGFAGFGQGCVGSVPSGVIVFVAGGASFAVTALTTSAAMQNNFMRTGDPVLVDEEFGSVGRWAGWPGDESDFGRHFLELRACIAPHGE